MEGSITVSSSSNMPLSSKASISAASSSSSSSSSSSAPVLADVSVESGLSYSNKEFVLLPSWDLQTLEYVS